jgi:PHD/YefM family antitoxin component YafN of YafNO toxin-antitoxin module
MYKVQSEAVSKFRDNYTTVFSKLEQGPVLLLQNSKVAAVLVSPSEWNAQQEELMRLRLNNEARQAFAQIKSGEATTISHNELKRLMLEKRNVGN